MNQIRQIASQTNTTAANNTTNRAETIRQIIVQKFLGFMFHPQFGVADHLRIQQTESIEDFAREFTPHGQRAIRIALGLSEDTPLDKVKQKLIGQTVDREPMPDNAKLMGMPEGVSVDEVKQVERNLAPLFGEMFGVDGTLSDDELHVVSNLTLGVIQREKYDLAPDASDDELQQHLMG